MATTRQQQSTGNQVGRYFDKASTIFDTFYDDQRSPFMRWVDRNFRRDIYDRFERTFNAIMPLEGKSVLDIGCGSGPYSVECARQGARRVVGLDLAEGMLELAQGRARNMGLDSTCEFIQGQFPDDAPDEIFDHALVMGVMDYIADKAAFVRALARCTAVSVVVSFPSTHWLRGPIRIVRYKLKRCPLWLYSRDQIAELMTDAGFASFEIDKIPGAGLDYVVVARKQADAR